MKTLIMGTGALGAFFGARLARSGAPVVFVARGATLAAVRHAGVRIESAAGVEVVAPLHAVADPAAAGACDLVLVCVKSYDTAAAARALRPAVHGETVVLSLQNGIENEACLAEVLGLPPLPGALTHIGAEMVAPAVVRHDSGGRIVFGEMDGRRSPRIERLATLFSAAGIDHRVSANIRVMLWDKLAWNAAFNAVSALTGCTVGELLRLPDGRALVRTAMQEVVAVARAAGVGLEAERVEAALAHSERELATVRTSMLQDRERGRRLEYDALCGAVLRAAAARATPAPVIGALYGLLAVLDRRRPAPA